MCHSAIQRVCLAQFERMVLVSLFLCCLLFSLVPGDAKAQMNISGSYFDCAPLTETSPAQSVHRLRPTDIKVVGALGNSLSAGFAIQATLETFQNFTEDRGLAWSAGGDSTLDYVTTLPNIIKEYNPNLIGFSVETTTAGQSEIQNNIANPNTGFNLAISGARAESLLFQAMSMVAKMEADPRVNIQEDWKLVTLLIGGNDLCQYCTEGEAGDPDEYVGGIRSVLDYLQDKLPRTLVNLVQIFDVTVIEDAASHNPYGPVCISFYNESCPCGPYGYVSKSDSAVVDATSALAREYQDGLADLVESGRYNDGDNFTVVLQPFFTDGSLPIDSNGLVDISTLAVDCFHFSPKGNRISAINLWNNMFQEVGEKTEFFDNDAVIICPTDDDPYIKTSFETSPAMRLVVSLLPLLIGMGLALTVVM